MLWILKYYRSEHAWFHGVFRARKVQKTFSLLRIKTRFSISCAATDVMITYSAFIRATRKHAHSFLVLTEAMSISLCYWSIYLTLFNSPHHVSYTCVLRWSLHNNLWVFHLSILEEGVFEIYRLYISNIFLKIWFQMTDKTILYWLIV